MKLSTLFLLAISLTPYLGFSVHISQPDSSNSIDSIGVLKDDPYAAMLDSMIHCYYEDLIALNVALVSPMELSTADTIPLYSSETYASRLSELDAKTPFDLSYNTTVEAFIHLYVSKKRSLSANSLGRSELYFPLFEETLDKHGLPLELKYLAVVESGLNPKARSRAGATGLWQFMYRTGKNFGLDINSYADERCDPALSTEAACQYLGYLYRMFDDWNLALAAYNCGEGRVTRAIRKSGGKRNYWEIYPYLPRETRGYVPAFIAVNYMFAYAESHAIYPTSVTHNAFEIDSVHLSAPATFAQVGKILDVDPDLIASLNPIYRTEVIPAYEGLNVMYLPKDKVNLWVNNEDQIKARLETEAAKAEIAEVPKPQAVTYYTVRSGDYLGKIASRYGCSVSQLQQWNNMRSTSLRVGQKLTIYADGPSKPKPSTKPKAVIVEDGSSTYYTIRSGDTLWDIAKERGASLEDLKRWNADVDFSRMKPGQKIIVGKK